MRELSLQEIKAVEFEVLKVFDAFCKKNNIRYYLSHGTLLGAIRYKKFIPWDDDIDVLVPREDYDRLIKIYQDSDRYHLYAFEKDPRYLFPFAKLIDLTTFKDEPGYDNGVKLGLDIDIFPLDAWDNDIKKAQREAHRIGKDMFRLSLTKLQKADSVNPIKRLVKAIYIAYCKLFGSAYFIKRIHNASNRATLDGNKYLGCKVWCVYGERGIIPAEAFATTVDVEFEGEFFPAPGDWDQYLTCLFGDYLPEPPPEKRKTHHVFTAYQLEE